MGVWPCPNSTFLLSVSKEVHDAEFLYILQQPLNGPNTPAPTYFQETTLAVR